MDIFTTLFSNVIFYLNFSIFLALLADNLNAEISLGTVTNVEEAVQWLSYTYLYVRMRKNPLVYGMKYAELKEDPLLDIKRTEIIRETARKLDRAKMIRFDERTGYLFPTDLGRTASQYYIKYDTIEVFNEILKPVMNEGELIAMLSKATEFEQQVSDFTKLMSLKKVLDYLFMVQFHEIFTLKLFREIHTTIFFCNLNNRKFETRKWTN